MPLRKFSLSPFSHGHALCYMLHSAVPQPLLSSYFNATSCCHVLLDCSLLTDNNKLKMTYISWYGNVSQAPPN